MIKSKFLLLICIVFLYSCDKGAIHKEYVEIPEAEWSIEEPKVFDFEITDASKPIEFSYLVRNAIQYPFYNLYLKTSLKDSTGKTLKGGMEELILFDQKTGQPKGDGLGDLFDHRVVVNLLGDFSFPYNGKYSLEIQHNMRPDPLLGLMGIGIEIRDTSQN